MCAHCTWVWYWLSGRMYTMYIYGDKHTSVREAIQMPLPNLSEEGSLRSPITITFMKLQFGIWAYIF